MSSVRQLPSGKWQAQIRPVPNGPQITKTSTKKGIVEAWLKQQVVAIETGTYVSAKSGRVAFLDYYEAWAPRQIWEANTARSMGIAVRSTAFAQKPLRAIERADLELWVKGMQTKPRGPKQDTTGRGLAASTIATRSANVRTVFRAAMADKRIGSDPTLGVRLPKKRRREAALRIPTVEHVRQWLDGADPQYQALIALCAFAGLRIGESGGLRVSDIHFTKRTIDAQHQVQRGVGGVLEIRPPKHGSERTLAAPSGLLTLLSAHMALLGLQGEPDAWLFPGEGNNPAHANTLGHAWRKARSAAG